MMANGIHWTADGRLLYTRRQTGGVTSFWAVPLDGRPPQLLVTFDPTGPMPLRGGWGFQQNRLVYAGSEHRGDIWVMNVETR